MAAIAALGVSLLIESTLNGDVNLVLADDRGQLVVVDVAIKSFKFQVAAVYVPNILAERVSLSQRLVPFLNDLKQIVLVGDWNAIFAPKRDRVGRGARESGRCESSLIDFMARQDLVDRFRLDHPGREMWTWLDSSPSVHAKSYLDRVLVRRADTNFVTCPMFYYVAQTDHRLVRVSLRLANRPSLAGHWKFNTSLLEIQESWDQLESLVQWALVGVVTGNKWWGSFKHRIRDFAIKYGRQLNLDRTNVAKSLEDKLSQAVEEGGFPSHRFS